MTGRAAPPPMGGVAGPRRHPTARPRQAAPGRCRQSRPAPARAGQTLFASASWRVCADSSAPNGAGAESFDQGAEASPDPGTTVLIILTAIGNQAKWILSQGRLEQQGCRFRYSHGPEGSWLVTPNGLTVRLGRDSLGLPHLHGAFLRPGEFVACQPEEPSSVPLLIDTGATLHVAGYARRKRLKVLPGVGISNRAVGGGVSASLGQGTKC